MDRNQMCQTLDVALDALKMTRYAWGNPEGEFDADYTDMSGTKIYEDEYGNGLKVVVEERLDGGTSVKVHQLDPTKKPMGMSEADLRAKKDRLMDELAEVTKMELELDAAKINDEVMEAGVSAGVTAEDLLENAEEDKSSPDSMLTDLFGRIRRLIELDEAKRLTEYGYDRYSQGGN